jgi:hypothetical protein
MRRDEEFFGDEPLELVHLSRRLKEAKGVEQLLTDEGVEYLLEVGPYSARLLFVIPVQRHGVYFYVREGEAAEVRLTLRERGFPVVEVLEDDDEPEGEAPGGP